MGRVRAGSHGGHGVFVDPDQVRAVSRRMGFGGAEYHAPAGGSVLREDSWNGDTIFHYTDEGPDEVEANLRRGQSHCCGVGCDPDDDAVGAMEALLADGSLVEGEGGRMEADGFVTESSSPSGDGTTVVSLGFQATVPPGSDRSSLDSAIDAIRRLCDGDRVGEMVAEAARDLKVDPREVDPEPCKSPTDRLSEGDTVWFRFCGDRGVNPYFIETLASSVRAIDVADRPRYVGAAFRVGMGLDLDCAYMMACPSFMKHRAASNIVELLAAFGYEAE